MKTTNRDGARLVGACKHSAAGLASTFRNEVAFRQELVLAVPHFLLLYFIGFPVWVWVALTALLGLVMAVELLNTAVECVVDLVSPGYHELAKRAKDAASAAVSVCLAIYLVSWSIVVAGRFLC